MDVTFKILKTDGSTPEATLSDLEGSTKLSEIRRQLKNRGVIEQAHGEKEYFVNNDGVQVQRGMEGSLKLKYDFMNDETDPPVVFMSQSPDLVGVRTEWFDAGPDGVTVKVRQSLNSEAKAHNKHKIPVIMLKEIRSNSNNITNFDNAVIMEADTAIGFEISGTGKYGFGTTGVNGEETMFISFGADPTGSNTERVIAIETYRNPDAEGVMEKDLIIMKDAKSEALHLSGKEVGKLWTLSINIWPLNGYEYCKNHKVTAKYGTFS